MLASIGVNLFNYLFHLASARLLSVNDFGAIQTILNLVSIITIFAVVIRMQLTKEFSRLLAANQSRRAADFASRVSIYLSILFLPLILLTLALTFLADIQIGLLRGRDLLATSLFAGGSLLLMVNRSLIRAQLRFAALALNTNLQAVLRLGLLVGLTLAHFRLAGALGAIGGSYVGVYLLSIWQLRRTLALRLPRTGGVRFRGYLSESARAVPGLLGLTSLVSLDLVLVQAFLPGEAGFYAGLTLFGRVIVFGTSPVSTVLFPAIVREHDPGRRARLAILSLVIVAVIAFAVLLLYALQGDRLLGIALSPRYLVIAELIPRYGFFAAAYSISFVIVNGFIGLDDYLPSHVAAAAAVGQVIGILLFHDSLEQVVWVSVATGAILLGAISLTAAVRFQMALRYTPTAALEADSGE